MDHTCRQGIIETRMKMKQETVHLSTHLIEEPMLGIVTAW